MKKYTQLAFFDLEVSNSDIATVAAGIGETISQDVHTVDTKPDDIVDDQAQKRRMFFTPGGIVKLMVGLLNPKPPATVYDPCCGSGAFLKAAMQYFEEKKYPEEYVNTSKLYGQEPFSGLCAQAREALSIYNSKNVDIREGDTLQTPDLFEGTNRLRRIDYIISNPPWNQELPDKYFTLASY